MWHFISRYQHEGYLNLFLVDIIIFLLCNKSNESQDFHDKIPLLNEYNFYGWNLGFDQFPLELFFCEFCE